MIFANIMQDKEGLNRFWEKAFHKYRFVIISDNSFEEKLSVKLSRLNVFSFSGFLIFFCFFSAILLIAYTPLKEYVPGKAKKAIQKELIALTIKADSLVEALETQDLYLKNINTIINGDALIPPKIIDTVKSFESEISFEKSIEDSLLRIAVEAEGVGAILINGEENNEVLMFFAPIAGMITSGFNPKTKHFGVDLVAKEKTRILSTLGGTVIISHWTSETGYVIAIQHKNDYVSLYKHNSLLLKEVGDFVIAGDHIAVIGNSGELSSGPHLHFELWHKGAPVNPEDYISF